MVAGIITEGLARSIPDQHEETTMFNQKKQLPKEDFKFLFAKKSDDNTRSHGDQGQDAEGVSKVQSVWEDARLL